LMYQLGYSNYITTGEQWMYQLGYIN
jgi:hypothetical protein